MSAIALASLSDILRLCRAGGGSAGALCAPAEVGAIGGALDVGWRIAAVHGRASVLVAADEGVLLRHVCVR